MGLTDLFDGLAEVAKMKIIAYEDANFETLSNKEFTVMYNPNTFSQSYRSVWNSETPEGGTAESQNYRRLESDSVSFEFLFDGTGVSASGESAILTIGASTDTDGDLQGKPDDC